MALAAEFARGCPDQPSRRREALGSRSPARAADRLGRSPTSRDRELLADTVGASIEYLGCWSVWATVLWERLGDPALLARLLLGAPRSSETTAAVSGPALSAYPFPATRIDWLPRDGPGPQEGTRG